MANGKLFLPDRYRDVLHKSEAQRLVCRFDHSPCDPAIHLRGSPSELFACVACAEHFPTKEEWRKHVQSNVNMLSNKNVFYLIIKIYIIDVQWYYLWSCLFLLQGKPNQKWFTQHGSELSADCVFRMSCMLPSLQPQGWVSSAHVSEEPLPRVIFIQW